MAWRPLGWHGDRCVGVAASAFVVSPTPKVTDAGCSRRYFPNSWYNYRVLVGFFRESLRGSQNPVPQAAGAKVAWPVFDDLHF